MTCQEALPFAPRVTEPSPYVPSPEQRAAGEDLLRRRDRLLSAPSGLTVMALIGPRGSGKTRLLEELYLSEEGFEPELIDIREAGPLEVFSEINRAAASRSLLVLEGDTAPARWFREHPDAIPDLFSRLTAAPVIDLPRPGPLAILAGLVADAREHDLRLSPEEAERVAADLPRDLGAPRRFCQAVDRSDAPAPRRKRLQWAVEQAHVRPERQDKGA